MAAHPGALVVSQSYVLASSQVLLLELSATGQVVSRYPVRDNLYNYGVFLIAFVDWQQFLRVQR